MDYQKLFDEMPAPRMVFVKNSDGGLGLLYINKAALKFFDASDKDILTRPVSALTHTDNARNFEESFEVCLSKKCAVTVKISQRSGDAQTGRDFTIVPILDEKQNVEGIDVLGHIAIGNRSNLQRERDDALSLMSSIFDVSEIGIIVTDEKRKIIRVNESFVRTYGWLENELVDNDFAGFVTPDLRGDVIEKHNEYIQSGLRSTGELKLIRKDGSIANILFTTATIELSQRRRFQVSTMMDITLRKRMEESLRTAKEQADSSNHAKSQFLANMSHELRTPLNAIIGFSEIMMEGTFGNIGNDRYAQYICDIHGSANHLLDIINEVLDMSKIEAGKIELDEHETDVTDVLNDVLRMMDSRAFSKSVKFVKNIPDDLPHLHADKKLLRQIFINIISNAVKFSKDSSEITINISLSAAQDMKISIQDHGIGIPQDKINQALAPFGQVFENAQHSSQQGTGLGLPLAKAMVELHGGKFELNSSRDEGTCVTMEFPNNRVITEILAPSAKSE